MKAIRNLFIAVVYIIFIPSIGNSQQTKRVYIIFSLTSSQSCAFVQLTDTDGFSLDFCSDLPDGRKISSVAENSTVALSIFADGYSNAAFFQAASGQGASVSVNSIGPVCQGLHTATAEVYSPWTIIIENTQGGCLSSTNGMIGISKYDTNSKKKSGYSLNDTNANPGQFSLVDGIPDSLNLKNSHNDLFPELFLGIDNNPVFSNNLTINITSERSYFELDMYSILESRNWWNNDIYFRVTTVLAGCPINIDYSENPIVLSRQIPPANFFSVKRTACGDTIFLQADPAHIANRYQYDYRISDQGNLNVFNLLPVHILPGNILALVPEDDQLAPNPAIYNLSIDDSGGGVNCPILIEGISIPAKPAPLEFTGITPTNLKCYQDDSGEFTVTISGGRSPYSISSNGINWHSGLRLTGLPAGHQPIFVRDADNCIIETDETLTQPPQLSASVSEIKNPDCFGDPSGRVTLIITGGTGEKQVSVNQSNWITGNVISGLPAGNYPIYVRDTNLCPAAVPVTLSQPPDISITATEIKGPTCSGFTDGRITVQATGGNGGFQFAWNTGATGTSLSSLGTGNFMVTVSDSKGCTKAASFTLSDPAPITFSVSKTMPTCHDSSDGSILAVASGGPGLTGPFDYLWSTGITTSLLSGIGKGNYVIEATDPAGCKGSETIVLDAPPPPSPGWEENSGIICEGDSLQLDGGDYASYLWYTSLANLSTSRHIYLKNPGNYFLDITDAKGCVGTTVFELIVLEEPIEGEVLLADTARVNEIISVIDVTWPVPDSIHWYFSKPVTIHERNSWSAHFSSAEEGLIAVTLRAWYAGCYSDSAKTVMIIDDGKVIEINTRGYERLIREFYLFPNPNSGYFNVDVKLRERTDISLSVYRASTSIAVYTDRFYGEEQYLIPVSLPGLRSGVYVVIVQAGNEREVLRMVIQ